MTATVIDLTERMDRAAERTRRTIRQLRDYRGLRTDGQLAAQMGMGRTMVNNLAIGRVKLTIETIAAFAAALDVPDYVLSMEADDALRWVMDNQPNGPTDPTSTTADLLNSPNRRKGNRTHGARILPLRSAEAA